MHEVELAGRQGGRGDVTSLHREGVVGEGVEEAGVGVDGEHVPAGADSLSQQLSDAAGAGAQADAAPTGGQAGLLAEPDGSGVGEPGQAAQPLAFGVPGRVEQIAGGILEW